MLPMVSVGIPKSIQDMSAWKIKAPLATWIRFFKHYTSLINWERFVSTLVSSFHPYMSKIMALLRRRFIKCLLKAMTVARASLWLCKGCFTICNSAINQLVLNDWRNPSDGKRWTRLCSMTCRNFSESWVSRSNVIWCFFKMNFKWSSTKGEWLNWNFNNALSTFSPR